MTLHASHFVWRLVSLLLVLLTHPNPIHTESRSSSDITANVFGTSMTDGIIAAFGDFNSDELTDVFVLKNEGRTLEVLLGYDVDPLLRSGIDMKCEYKDMQVMNVVPGDFDGDAYMDLLVATKRKGSSTLGIYVNWGGSNRLNCSGEGPPLFEMIGEPMALDYNLDMIIDLFGLNINSERTFWEFNEERTAPKAVPMILPKGIDSKLKVPHSHAYLDLNNDFMADLFVVTTEHFEVWHGVKDHFEYSHKIPLPQGNFDQVVGQSLFLDVQLTGQLNQLLPMCFDKECSNSTLLIHSGNQFHDMQINFKDNNNNVWGFVKPRKDHLYLNAITLRGGDFNMDGYPDLLVTLQKTSGGKPQTFLLENVKCEHNCGPLKRKFIIKWGALSPFAEGMVAGAFYDFYQDGILDVIFVEETTDGRFRPVAFRNLLDYDANFIKCIVLTSKTGKEPMEPTRLGRKKRTYGE